MVLFLLLPKSFLWAHMAVQLSLLCPDHGTMYSFLVIFKTITVKKKKSETVPAADIYSLIE